MFLTLREAKLGDVDFLVEVDRKDEGCTSIYSESWGEQEVLAHRAKIASFVTDDDKAAWVFTSEGGTVPIAMILWRYRSSLSEITVNWQPQACEVSAGRGAVCEIFQLWVNERYRRRGLATMLKNQAEKESARQGIGLLYTHTEERNQHVIDLNTKLGYHEIRRGVLWDSIVRVSLIKALPRKGFAISVPTISLNQTP